MCPISPAEAFSLLCRRNENLRLIKCLLQHQVAFIVIGGTALVHHGCRDSAAVGDLDILVDPAPTNAERLKGALLSADVQVSESASQLTRPALQIPIKNFHYWAEILTPRVHLNFSALAQDAEIAAVDSVNVPVASRSALIALKQDAIEQIQAELGKHQDDLDNLTK